MRYTLENGKVVTIPDNEIEKSMKALDLSREEAIQMWLDDNDYSENDEQTALEQKAKSVKIDHGAGSATPRKKSDKPRVIKVSDAKKSLFTALDGFLEDFAQANDAKVRVLTENKLIEVDFGGEIFKIDLIQTRKPKKN